jgi:Icc protein
MAIRLLQLTDLHLSADPEKRVKGVPPRAALGDVIGHIRTGNMRFDHIVITGDLADDGLPETYRLLRSMLGDWFSRCHVIPGNHDSRDAIRTELGKAVGSSDGPLTFAFSADNWRILGLDSLVAGEVCGRIDEEQLDWLRAQLLAFPRAPTLLLLHHPPVPVGSRWIDRLRLQDADDLIDLIGEAKQVKYVSAGHVHQEFTGRVAQATFLTTPSTVVQFAPATDELTLDAVPPGFRIFELDGDKCATTTVRLADLRFPPNVP